MVNTILAKRVNHIVAKGDHSVWPKGSKSRGFSTWAAVFAKKTTDYEFSITNEIVQKERFRHFIKVPELAAFYAEICDYRTAKDIGIDRTGEE